MDDASFDLVAGAVRVDQHAAVERAPRTANMGADAGLDFDLRHLADDRE